MIKRLLRLVGRWARKPVNHTSWVAVVTPTDRPKSVRNRCLIELFCGVVCVVTLPFWHFCWCRGFCHRTESDLFLFLLFIFWGLIFIFFEKQLLNKITPEPLPCANWGGVKPLSHSCEIFLLCWIRSVERIVPRYSSVRLFVLIASHQNIYHKEFIMVPICGPNGSMFG